MTEPSNPKSKLGKSKYVISKAHPFEDALGYIEQITRRKEEWPIDRLTQVKLVLRELDSVMQEYSKSVSSARLPKGNE